MTPDILRMIRLGQEIMQTINQVQKLNSGCAIQSGGNINIQGLSGGGSPGLVRL